jgi:murein DD-endopeptidase MepM/ murein hydrolase activator NlpD
VQLSAQFRKRGLQASKMDVTKSLSGKKVWDPFMKFGLLQRFDRVLSGLFPERRVFLKSDDDTRFIRLNPSTQASIFVGMAGMIAWSIVATAILLIDSIGAGNFREQAIRDQETYQQRLEIMAAERDASVKTATAIMASYDAALIEIANMQERLLNHELNRLELTSGVDVLQSNLNAALVERSELTTQLERAQSDDSAAENAAAIANLATQDTTTIEYLTTALRDTAQERDKVVKDAQTALNQAEELRIEMRLLEERNELIFRQIEDAMNVSLGPLDKMFRASGQDPERIMSVIRQGYAGYGGPLTSMSTRGLAPTENEARAIAIIKELDELNLYRIAVEKLPYSHPVQSAHRFTSGFGRRWGRMHYGSDFAAPHGTPIYATADGVITKAGWATGYGRLIKIKHDFGIETRYAHLSKIRVKVGQKVSRGDRIGDMGNTGRSTGTHLHYEIRVNGNAVNPMKYLKAGKNVF